MEFNSHSEKMMGTIVTIFIMHENSKKLLEECFKMLKIYEHRFSANANDSELMQVNHNAGIKSVVVHKELFELISLGREHSLADKSHLNIAIGPLVQTWRIGFKDANVPKQNKIDEVLDIIDPKCIELDEKSFSVYLTKSKMKIDLGAVAKGYIADKIAEYLKKENVTSALINLGGNIVTIGKNAKKELPWCIGIQNPTKTRGKHLALLSVENKSVVTSGIYERQLVYNGKSYHHIFDTKTGYPVETDVASLTIVSEKSVDGEIWTTRLFGESLSSIIMQVESTPNIEAIIITKDNKVYRTTGLLSHLEIL